MFLLLLSLLSVDPRYHNYAQTATECRRLATDYSAICRLETIGVSTTNQWPLLCLKLSDHPDLDEDEPHLLFNGVHHACELIGDEICLYMANDLLTRYGSDPDVTRWLDSNQIFIVPLVNPDGHEINLDNLDTIWRKNIHDFNHNGHWDPDTDGVDLNRNYDFLFETGDSTLGHRYYRGPAPFSENETQAIRDLSEREKFVFDICWHSSIAYGDGQAVYFPWRWGNSWCPDYPEIKTIADSIARRITNDLGNGYYATIYGRADDGAVSRNWMYHALGIFSYTIEVSTGYQPPGYRVDSICQHTNNGAYFLPDRCHRSILTGHVTDSATGRPLIAEVKILEATSAPDTIAPRLTDSTYGRYWRPLQPRSYTVQVSKYGYYTVTDSGVTIQANAPTVLDVRLARNLGIQDYQYPRPSSRSMYLDAPILARGLSSAQVRYQLTQAEPIQLAVYDRLGRRVRVLVKGKVPAGNYQTVWTGATDFGSRAAPGIYFIALHTSSASLTRKLVLP